MQNFQHPTSGLRRIVWCYCGMPLTSGCLLWSRHPEVRFHAWQTWYLGLLYIGVLAGLGMMEVVFGLWVAAAGRSVEYLVPLVAAMVAVLWLSALLRVLAGHPGRLPVVGRWAERHI